MTWRDAYKTMKYRHIDIESEAICEPRFQRATVLAQVCKISTLARHAKLFFELTKPKITHTQWFPRSSQAGNTICIPFVPLLAVRRARRLIAKRYVCAAKSFEARLNIYVVPPADSPNVTCVRPARFRPLRQATARRFGPAEGHETLRT